MFERYDDRARRVVVLAQEEARMLNHNYIGTEHILLGLIHDGAGVAAEALWSLNISLEGLREQVQEIIGRGRQAPAGQMPFTPRAQMVLELSLRKALELGHNCIGTEHILLGLIGEGEGVAAQVLVKVGADLGRVRQQVIRLLADYQGEGADDERISAEKSPTVATVREDAGVSNADATKFPKEWRAERDSAGSTIAATPETITEQALRLAGTVWAEAVRTATAEHAIIEKAWRDEKAHKDREINELATDLDDAARTHEETVKELRTQVDEANEAARDHAAAATEAREQLTLAARKHAEEVAELKSQLAEARATAATLQQTQEALIARIQPSRESKPVRQGGASTKG